MEVICMKNKLCIAIGKRVRDMREKQNYTREDFSELADISVQFIAEIETGKKNMSTNSLFKVSKALHVSSDYLVFGNDTKSDFSEIEAVLSGLSQNDLKFVEELLITFVKAVSE